MCNFLIDLILYSRTDQWLERLEGLTVNANITGALSPIPASSDTVESEGGR
jgi:hypothetical protein